MDLGDDGRVIPLVLVLVHAQPGVAVVIVDQRRVRGVPVARARVAGGSRESQPGNGRTRLPLTSVASRVYLYGCQCQPRHTVRTAGRHRAARPLTKLPGDPLLLPARQPGRHVHRPGHQLTPRPVAEGDIEQGAGGHVVVSLSRGATWMLPLQTVQVPPSAVAPARPCRL